MIDVLGADGAVKGKVELPEAVFGQPVHSSLVWESVKAFLANQRQGTAATKTRGEVSGTGKKPYRQKHTGRARHGSRRSPIFVGGGIAWGPKPRDYSQAIPKKKRRAALVSALSARHAEGGIVVVEDFELNQPKTKELVGILKAMGLGPEGTSPKAQAKQEQPPAEEKVLTGSSEGRADAESEREAGSKRVLLLVGAASEKITRASRNVPWLTVMPSVLLNPYAVLRHERVVFTRTGLERFLAVAQRAS
ncbi:MAG: 50S ribosomal protein L4 [candidate division WOR-3 bacterium]